MQINKSDQITNKIEEIISQSKVNPPASSSETIKLWEGYREQALLWRALALLQIPTTLLMIAFSLLLYSNRKIILNVPAKPLPGLYTAQQISDTEFIEAATNYINLIASYQPAVARRQFEKAREMVVEPMLSRFDLEMLRDDLKTIESTKRTQLFFIDPIKTTVNRDGSEVKVSLFGERLKIVAGRELPLTNSKFDIYMTTIPRNDFNPYGIVIKNVVHENLDERR